MTVQLEQQENALSQVCFEMSDRFSLEILAAKELGYFAQKSLEVLEKEIKALRTAIQEAGDVNMTSIEECENIMNGIRC